MVTQRSSVKAVLESDTVREDLLLQERNLAVRLKEGEEGLSTDLTTVFEQLEALESDSASARASVILAGLGFTHEMQGSVTCTISGGWRMHIDLAQALFCRPDLLRWMSQPTCWIWRPLMTGPSLAK